MAFNWQTFRTRTLTAIVFAAIMLLGLFWNPWSFLVLFSIIHFGCWWEYLKLTEKIHKTPFHIYTKLGLMLMGYGLMLWFCGPSYQISNYGLKENLSLPISGAGFILMVAGIFQKNAVNVKAFGMTVLGLVYISLCWGLMIDLFSSEHSFDIHIHDTMYVVGYNVFTIAIIAGIWINDTMAYLVGSLIGKTQLSKISPRKTWEGTIGGIVLCIVLMYFLWNRLVYSIPHNPVSIIFGIIGAITAVTGVIGDLLESKLKRMAGVKDSGTLLPGHGGFLDRFDSLLLATPAVWLYVRFFML